MTDWDELVRDEGPAVWRTLWRLLGRRADVEECFQETFLAALRYGREQRRDVRQWCALLQRMATARAVDKLRQRYRRRDVSIGGPDDIDVDASPSPRPGPVERAVAAELSENLRRALTRLPDEQAEAFCLHALSGWSYEEVGRQLGMSSNAVGVSIHRARRRLRELLGAAVNDASAGGGRS
jgi:RNA polymerase sigma-70 factor, ECF subfamily